MQTSDDILEFLLATNMGAFDDENFDSAYHFLAAAVHLAQAIGCFEKLDSISIIANNQMRKIDKDKPEYHHSTESALQRGTTSIFGNLSRQAHIASRIAQARNKRELDGH